VVETGSAEVQNARPAEKPVVVWSKVYAVPRGGDEKKRGLSM